MALGPGMRAGHYEVLDLLGEGGMGAVYRARDTRLMREVAIKVIRRDLTADRELISRFGKEARLLAALSHPNIATIHGFEEAEGERLLVMELVPGATLAERLSTGPVPVDEAIAIALQIAGAIEMAHGRGIIHRDLKPANIKLTPDGIVKVLDFGLAKALVAPAALSLSPTVTSGGTREGMLLGTAAYMSPEQARGKDVDEQTDIWAFGCVLHEMLTGQPAFGAATLSDTIAATLTREPDFSRLPHDVPGAVLRVLRRSLVKETRHRLRDIGDARIELEEAGLGDAVPVPSPARRQSNLRSAAVFLAGALAGAATLWLVDPRAAAPSVQTVRFALPLEATERLAGLDFPAIAISPNDSHVAYVATVGGDQQVFLRDLSQAAAVVLPGTAGAISPFFSPDGRWIAFFAEGKLKKVPVGGGPVQDIANAAIGFGGSWGADNTIVFAPDNGSALWRVSADGGEARPLTTLDKARGEFSHRWPDLAPDGKSALVTVGTKGTWDDAEIVAVSIADGKRRTIVQGGSNPHYLSDGRVLFVRAGSLYAVPSGGAQATENASLLLEGVAESLDGAAQAALSRTGSLAFVPGSGEAGAHALVWVDRHGQVQPLAAPRRTYESPRLSPDGRTIAVTIGTGDRDEVWTYDVARASLKQLTFNGGSAPAWTADGARLAFSSRREGLPALFVRKLDTSASDERRGRAGRARVPLSIAPDGTIACVEYDTAGRDVVLLKEGDATPHPFLASPANESAAAFSPDGRWLAFVSDRSGRNEVYITPASDPARPMQVSNDGGTEPVWRRGDGQELFFRSDDRMLSAAIHPGSRLAIGKPAVLFDAAFEPGVAGRPGYDVSADGARFLMVHGDEQERPAREVRVILGFVR